MFERCAVDLLRCIYPGLVPIRGGDDGGMDGAIADPRGGSPIPLVVTTAGSVIGNLTKNLESYRRDGGAASEAVLATSRPLSARQRRNLERRAREFGFTLRQIHDQADFVGRLYRDPAWRRELLGLTGNPPALSAFPRSPRPWPTSELLGRDEELTWLREAEGDVVVSGQPGVGKTALLGTLAKEGYGLFVVSAGIGKIADALRELRPDRVFVDDAHLDSTGPRDSLLGTLNRLRLEAAMSFRIVATTWPGHEDDIRQALYLPRDQVRRVRQLERSVMADIVRAVNPLFADMLIGEILDQSEGRPGLAVTLAQWALRGELQDLVNGQLLLRQIKQDLPRPGRTLDALAPFALAGRYGMRLRSAAQALAWPEDALREALRPVSGTGVLRETDDDDPHRCFIGVEPEVLRVALVERAYFSGALSMAVEPALEQVEDPDPCTHTLIQVLARGGRVPHGLIRERLEELHRFSWPGDLWEHYVGTGKEAALWVMETHPDRVASAGRTALEIVPDVALDALLGVSAEGIQRADDPTRTIENWVSSGLPGQDAAERRIMLIRALVTNIQSIRARRKEECNLGQQYLAKLLPAAFSLAVEDMRTSPVDPMSLTITSGSLLPDEVREIAREWPAVLDALQTLGEEGVRCARHIFQEWTCGFVAHGQHPETNPTAREEAPRMLQDVVELAQREPGVVMWARKQVRDQKLKADLPRLHDPLFDELFPVAEDPWEESFLTEILVASARDLAEQWHREDPPEVAGRMAYYEHQRQLADYLYPSVLGYLPGEIAQRVEQPSKWLEAFVDQKVPPSWIEPLLEAAVAHSPASDTPWDTVTRDARYDWICADVGLRLSKLPESSVGCILMAVRRVVEVRHDILPWGDLSREWQYRLLGDSNARLRAAAAAALWRVHGGVRPSGRLGRLLWDAVIESGDPALLRELLETDRMAARDWILRQARASSTQRSSEEEASVSENTEPRLAPSTFDLAALSQWRVSELLGAAVAVLTIEDRRDLILAISSRADERFFRHLVCGDPGLYRVLLQRPLSRQSHLAPLALGHLENRDYLVQLARERGYSDCELANPIGSPKQEPLPSQGPVRFSVP